MNTYKCCFSFMLVVQILFCFQPKVSNGQEYKLVWEDNFDGTTLDSEKWNIEHKIGVWNTGANSEFQHYKRENVSVGDDGDGNSCLILTAKKENFNGYHFTSGKVTTKGKFAFKRGKLEASIKIPNLNKGLWPAFWTLGYTPVGWPDCGEIDVLEMGHAAAIKTGKVNSFVGAHLFWGPYPRDYGKEFVADQDLSTGFFKHTVIWDEKNISVFLNDAASPYFTMGITGSDTEEFRNFQHYVILNLAVGGSVPGIYNYNEITANFPASMYVDWVKLYQLAEDFSSDELPLYGSFGVFQDEAPVDMWMDLGFDLFEQNKNLKSTLGVTPKAGSNLLSYSISGNDEFVVKLSGTLNRNLSNYSKGSIQFNLKTNIKSNLQIGFADAQNNEAFVSLADYPDLDIPRDGEWHSLYIPINELKDRVDISTLKSMLIVKGEGAAGKNIAIDEVFYSETAPVGGLFGIYTNNTTITEKFAINNVSGHLYNWENTVAFNALIPAYEGEEVLSFRSTGGAGWWGFGLFSSNPLNLNKFTDGYLNLMLRTNASQTFNISVEGANKTKATIEFKNNNDPYGFLRDGKWHRITVPVSDLLQQGLDLSACANVFTMNGSTIGDIAIDDVYFSETNGEIDNPSTCYPVSLSISPKNKTLGTNKEQQFSVSALNQFGNIADTQVAWSSSGGSINENGLFASDAEGVYTIWAHQNDLVDSTTITVKLKNQVLQTNKSRVEINYFSGEKRLVISQLDVNDKIVVCDFMGRKFIETTAKSERLIVELSNYPSSVYVVSILGKSGMLNRKIVRY
ncbi:MAG TPA: family 16 glycosylhydrolase [Prolixibacteraceae bacterium]|nr:family 16 glycosylhydrolase [Prolixibacteraceae bacterium]